MSSQMSALELLKLGDSDRKKPFLNTIWPAFLGVPFGVGAGCMINFATRRPVFSGLQKHVLLAAGTTAVLQYLQFKRDEYFAERDAVLRHYVELHPEDFPTPQRQKIGDVFEPWIPIR